jgi:glutaredoxin
VREFLSDNDVPFEDRNIRQSEEARAELEQRSADLIVPQLFWGDLHIVGFDPEALDRLVHAYRTAAA